MRVVKFLLVFGILTGLIFLLNTHAPFQSSLPALGKVLNPFTGFWQNAEAASIPDQLEIKAAELSEPVEVFFDQRLVPHIYAASNEDAAFVQGYIHGMHRLWQMDIATRAVSGRLSEVLGERTLQRDITQRKKGMTYAAENALRAWMSSPQEAAMLNAYAAGVNAYVDQLQPKDYPVEFKLLGYQPEGWTPMKSALFLKYMAESLCSRHQDLQTTNAYAALGEEIFDLLYPEYNPRQSPIIPVDIPFDFEAIEPFPAPLDSNLLGMTTSYELFDLPPAGNGSNNWAVAPEKTAAGNAILCSDPHLGLTLPSIWYESHISTPELDAYGVSLPAEPGILIGFNQYIAWAETNVGHDVLDWYTIDWANEEKTAYYYEGETLRVNIRRDTVRIKGGEPHVEETKYTVWGPIVYEDSTSQYQDLAMRWIAHDQPTEKAFYELGTFWKLMAAKNHQDYQSALKGYESPAQNFAFASRNGNIAITVNGNLPVKRDQQGRFIQDGSESENAWNGYIPRDQIPQVLNPERGFISSANQHSTGPDYPYYYNAGFDDYRGRTVNGYLDTMQQITVADMMQMQTSDFSLYAKEALAAWWPLLEEAQLSAEEKSAAILLRDWDYHFKSAAKAPVLFEIWQDSIYRMTFDEVFSLAEDQSMLYPQVWRLIELLETSPQHAIFDNMGTEAIETAADIVLLAFQKAVADWPEEKTWADHNQASVNHMAGIAPFGRSNLDMSGNDLSINAIQADHGPSWRMIVEMDPDGVRANGLYPGGQSGNPGSRYYDNMVDDWANGRYQELFFPKNKQAIPEEEVLFTMTFTN